MGEEPRNEEERLLARLNALKPSSISLGNGPYVAGSAIAHGDDQDPEDLIARFQILYGKNTRDDIEERTPRRQEPIEPVPSSPTIEDLLAELEENEAHQLKPSEEHEARMLVREARDILSGSDIEKGRETPPSNHNEQGNAGVSPLETKGEEIEVHATLERILDEVKRDNDNGKNVHSNAGASNQVDQPPHPALPSVPIESLAGLQFPVTPDDDPLDGNLDLPSAPKNIPSTVKGKGRDASEQKKPGYSDEGINSCCIICCANASVQCFGCDKDLYCWGCWREGHMGERAGLEERTHVWERYRRG